MGKPRIALVTSNASDYWTAALWGAEQAARGDGFELVFKAPASGTVAEQDQIVKDVLAEGVDGIAISPIDPASQVPMLNEAAAKTLLFTIDSDAPQSKRLCFVGSDEIRAGRQAGAEVKRALPRGGDIMVFVGKIEAPNARDRLRGLQQALRGSRVRVLGVRTDDTDRAKAKSNVADALASHPNLAACVGLWSYNGPAIWNAVREARKLGRVKIIAFDEEEATLDGVQSGDISATIVQPPAEQARLATHVMAAALGGDRAAIPASGQILVPSMVVRRADVPALRARLKKALAR